MDEENSKHEMVTRSKRKKGNLDLSEDKKPKIIDSDNELEIEELNEEPFLSSDDSDIDDHGNIKGLIDYDYKEESNILNIPEINSEDDIDYLEEEEEDFVDEDFLEEEDIDDEEMLIGKLLSRYINDKMDNNQIEEETKEYDDNKYDDNKYDEILRKYDRQMRQFFYDLDEKKKDEILSIENEIKSINQTVTPLRFQLLTSNLDNHVKAIAIRKIENLSNMDPGSGEYFKTKNWVEGLLQIPFGIYKELPVNIKNNNKDEITDYLLNANRILNSAVYGHKKAKCQILQIVSQWISNPQAKGSVFSIMGPMGNGKTTLVKEGISKMINRPFEFISLGGATDACYLDGHSYTYEGSIPGKIVDIVKKSKCMNPVIYFDELDKVSETPKGEEIINLLIHLTDFSQNDHFIDKYYNNIPIDLSKALFIFSLNDLERVNPILRDRMFMIQTNKLKEEDKLVVAKDYLIEGIFKDMGVDREELIFGDDVIMYIVKTFSQEEGVRNLKRAFQTIIGKLNIIRITKKGSLRNLDLPFEMDDFEFPLEITESIVNKLIETNKKNDAPPDFMYT
jgi:ATP-dependent Lon protease